MELRCEYQIGNKSDNKVKGWIIKGGNLWTLVCVWHQCGHTFAAFRLHSETHTCAPLYRIVNSRLILA